MQCIRDSLWNSHNYVFLKGFWAWSASGALCLRRQLEHCCLWIRNNWKSHPNHWRCYERPPALEITEHLCCWPPFISPAWGSRSITSRCSRGLVCSSNPLVWCSNCNSDNTDPLAFFRVMSTVWLAPQVMTVLPWCMQGTNTWWASTAFPRTWLWLTATIPTSDCRAAPTGPEYTKTRYVSNIGDSFWICVSFSFE